MEKIEIPMTKTQCKMIRAITDGTTFALISQPLVYAENMRVLILTKEEFRIMNKFFKTFIPKKLMNKTRVTSSQSSSASS